ncbi:MAG: FprA family A-type flavoprotein [Defluviitoga tunisiensis]
MNSSVKITDDIYYVGVNDRDTALFENLWPLDKGVSYNSYLILDEKTALIDTVKESKISEFFDKIRHLLNGRALDYLIINHMEPDHSGSIPELLQEFPGIKIVGNKTTFQFIKDLYKVEDNFQEIKDGSVLNLGKHTLKFYLTPMVHWPETMMTYDEKDKILFSGDAFGGFGTLDGGIFDDEVRIDFFEDEIRRYFSNIIGKYTKMVQRALNKLKDANIDIDIIAATHGPVWRKDPKRIIDLYDKWSRCETEKGVVIVYGSMYGNTEEMAEYVARRLAEEGIKEIKIMSVSKTHISYIINEIWKYKGVILGSCTYTQGLFPYMESLVQWLAHNDIKNHVLGIFGTYGWSGGGVSTLVKYNEQMKWPLVYEPVEAKLSAKSEDFKKLDELSKAMAREINS